jgi:hypothetical protein
LARRRLLPSQWPIESSTSRDVGRPRHPSL